MAKAQRKPASRPAKQQRAAAKAGPDGAATVAKAGDAPWAWPESRWRAIVEKVRAGRSLKPTQWKDGARVAVALSFDSDHESWVLREGGNSPAGLAMGQYGAKAAMPR